MNRIGEGAEAVIYKTMFMSESAILKRRIEKSYREPSIDSALRRQRTKNEARALAASANAGVPSPTVFLVTEYEILMSEMKGVMLSKRDMKSGKERRSIMHEIGHIAAELHNARVAHGDFTPANIIVSGGHAAVIDFGLATMLPTAEDKAMDLVLMKRAVAKDDYHIIESSYRKRCADAAKVIRRLNSIERRGRYKARTLDTA